MNKFQIRASKGWGNPLNRKYLLPLIWLACACPTLGAGSGAASAEFLRISPGPRAAGMGEAQVGLADDVYAAHWNPAGLAQLQASEAAFVQNQYLEDIQMQYAAFAHPFRSAGTLAGSVNFLRVGRFAAYDAAGQPIGTVDAYDLSTALSYARLLGLNRRTESKLAAGITAKYIQEQLDNVSAQAFAADAGLLYAPGETFGDFWRGWRAGLVMRNFGSNLQYDSESFKLPRSASAGLSWSGTWLQEEVTLALDAERPSAGRQSFGGGVEITTLHRVILRGGYTTRGDGGGFRIGMGLRLKSLQVDYAFAANRALGDTHRVGITVRFGKAHADPLALANRSYRQGLKEYRRGHYSEALILFNQALELDSSHPEALQKMRETYEKLKPADPR